MGLAPSLGGQPLLEAGEELEMLVLAANVEFEFNRDFIVWSPAGGNAMRPLAIAHDLGSSGRRIIQVTATSSTIGKPRALVPVRWPMPTGLSTRWPTSGE